MRLTPKRILLVESNDDGTVGGSHQCLFDLAAGMDRARYTPTVLFYEHNAYVERLEARGVRVLVWDAERQRERSNPFRSALARKLYARAAVVGAVVRRTRLLRRERIDLVHLNNSPCIGFEDWLPATRLLRVPCIAHARAGYKRPGSRFGAWLTRRFDRFIAISRYISANVREAGVPSDRIRQIYDGIDLAARETTERSDPERTRRSLALSPSAMLIAMVGHLRSWKGQDVVLAALRELDPALRARLHVVFVGGAPKSDANYQEGLLKAVREGGITDCVTFLGERSDVHELMNASDVVLHASSIPEPFGLVVLEGMALGKAVVASELGGPSEIVTADSGVLFDPSRPRELADRLVGLLNAPDRRLALGDAARLRARAFDVRINVERIQGVYAELLGDAS